MKNHPYRISVTAVGKISAELVNMTRSSELPEKQFHATMLAVLDYIETEREPTDNKNVNMPVWLKFKAKIDKAARLSALARARAARKAEANTGSSDKKDKTNGTPDDTKPEKASAMPVQSETPKIQTVNRRERRRRERIIARLWQKAQNGKLKKERHHSSASIDDKAYT